MTDAYNSHKTESCLCPVTPWAPGPLGLCLVGPFSNPSMRQSAVTNDLLLVNGSLNVLCAGGVMYTGEKWTAGK